MRDKDIEDVHPNELLNEIKSFIIIDLYRPNLNSIIGELLPESKPGLFFKNSSKNILPDNKKFFIMEDNILKPLIITDDIINNPRDIYTADGDIYITKRVIYNNSKNLSIKPEVSSYLLDIVQSYLLSKMDKVCYKTNLCPINFLYSYIDDNYIDSIENVLDDELCESVSDIYEFVGKDYWNIYFKKRVNETLLIEKSIDWRIYEWHKIQYENKHN